MQHLEGLPQHQFWVHGILGAWLMHGVAYAWWLRCVGTHGSCFNARDTSLEPGNRGRIDQVEIWVLIAD